MTTRRTTKKKPRKKPEEHRCHDCGIREGELHKPGCDMERCPFCGGQLLGCSCRYTKLGYTHDYNASFCGLPPEVYLHGPSDEEEDRFQKMCDEHGRIPYIMLPNMCGRCGKLWPEMFRVPDEEWLFYLGGRDEETALCRKCYGQIKRLIDTRSGIGGDCEYPPRVTETLAARDREWREDQDKFHASYKADQETLVKLGLKTREQIAEEAIHG